jgi:hypothetical protein
MQMTLSNEQRSNLEGWARLLRATELQQQTGESLFVWTGDWGSDKDDNSNYGYCCLAVWAVEKHPERIHTISNNDLFEIPMRSVLLSEEERRKKEIRFSIATLPLDMVQELGLDTVIDFSISDITAGILTGCTSLQTAFIDMNDSLKWDFKRIADEIDYLLKHNTLSDNFFKLAYR